LVGLSPQLTLALLMLRRNMFRGYAFCF
jgi:hypothetical protein